MRQYARTALFAPLAASMVIKGLIAREPTGSLYLTKDGRAALRTLVGEHL